MSYRVPARLKKNYHSYLKEVTVTAKNFSTISSFKYHVSLILIYLYQYFKSILSKQKIKNLKMSNIKLT